LRALGVNVDMIEPELDEVDENDIVEGMVEDEVEKKEEKSTQE
jgi:hypothetical protein